MKLKQIVDKKHEVICNTLEEALEFNIRLHKAGYTRSDGLSYIAGSLEMSLMKLRISDWPIIYNFDAAIISVVGIQKVNKTIHLYSSIKPESNGLTGKLNVNINNKSYVYS